MEEARPIEAADGPQPSPSPPADVAEPGDARLRRLIIEHFDFVWRLLRRLGVREGDVDDAAQELFIVVSRRLAQVEIDKERSFVVGAAIRIASTWRRSAARRRDTAELTAHYPVDAGPNPEELADRNRNRQLLEQVLLEMDLDQRSVFILHELEQLSLGEAAELLGIPPGTAASRLRRARATFFASVKRLQAKRAFVEGKT